MNPHPVALSKTTPPLNSLQIVTFYVPCAFCLEPDIFKILEWLLTGTYVVRFAFWRGLSGPRVRIVSGQQEQKAELVTALPKPGALVTNRFQGPATKDSHTTGLE